MGIEPEWLQMESEFSIWTWRPIISQSEAYRWTSMLIISQSEAHYWTSMSTIRQSKALCWSSMPIISQSEAFFWTSKPFGCLNLYFRGLELILLGVWTHNLGVWTYTLGLSGAGGAAVGHGDGGGVSTTLPIWSASGTITPRNQIEVRDSRTGYVILARYGMGVWPDGKIVGASVAAAVGIIWKFRSTFKPGNYMTRFSYGFGFLVRDLGQWRLRFYAEFRCADREHSGSAWGAVFEEKLVRLK